MATIAGIKTAIKALLDATSEFGSVYTEDRERIENPNLASITMFHDGGNEAQNTLTSWKRTLRLLVRILVPRAPTDGETVMQTTVDSKIEALLEALHDDPTLSDTVEWVSIPSWDVTYDQERKRMVAELTVSIAYKVT